MGLTNPIRLAVKRKALFDRLPAVVTQAVIGALVLLLDRQNVRALITAPDLPLSRGASCAEADAVHGGPPAAITEAALDALVVQLLFILLLVLLASKIAQLAVRAILFRALVAVGAARQRIGVLLMTTHTALPVFVIPIIINLRRRLSPPRRAVVP